MPPRDELLLIIDLTASMIRAGVGVKDMIDRPKAVCPSPSCPPDAEHTRTSADSCAVSQEVSTRVGRRPSSAPYKMTDYVVGQPFLDAEAAGDELEVVFPMTVTRLGLEVLDWTALEAILSVHFPCH